MRTIVLGVLLGLGCGGDASRPGERCRGGGGDLSARDVCYCQAEILCAKIPNTCKSTKFASADACMSDPALRGACDRESAAAVYGPSVIAGCLPLLDSVLSCDQLGSAVLEDSWQWCMRTGRAVACTQTCVGGDLACGGSCQSRNITCNSPPIDGLCDRG